MSIQVHDMFKSIASRYDFANDVLSLGIHRLWRYTLADLLEPLEGKSVLDICCGTGDVAFVFSQRVGNQGKVIGIDFVEDMIKLANKKLSQKKSENVTFSQGDALNLPFSENHFDIATVSFGIRNVDSPLNGLKEMYRVLKVGGKVGVLEFGQPYWPIFSSFYSFYSKYLMPIIGGLVTGNKNAYSYLPETSAAFPAGEKFSLLLSEAGLSSIVIKPLLGGLAWIYIGDKEK